ncbi:hypothetical protein [Methanoregula sp. UBA64]|jgi:hypothetical protein|uniref:hypothetical protein n=1 Tax=Methanoregula sp. UBA64 TaxID=1915554 RepID=UPI0025E41EB0|nr:hypothetical protein [Methanoregula sp. UBA64]
MTSVQEITGYWLGLCRKPPVVQIMQPGFGFPAGNTVAGTPDGGGGSGSGSVRRGIGAAISGMKTLCQNRQLLWFTLFAGLVLAANAIGHAAFEYLNRFLQPGTMVYYIQDFVLAFATLFLLVFLLAGLVLNLSSKKEGPASFFGGLCEAKKYLKTLFIWALVLAFAAFLLDRLYVFVALVWFPHEFGFLYTIMDGSFVNTINQFPFNWTLDWDMLTEVPGYGGRSLLLLVYPFGVLETLHFLMIALVLFILTPFVVPQIVLGQKSVREAVVGSFALLKKSWAGVVTCVLFLAAIVAGAFLVHVLLQAASGIIDPWNTVIFHPPATWIALALLYNIVLLTVAFVLATAGGIAVLDLYRAAKTGLMPESTGTKPAP